jgi:SAM-dependent methyltransferase
MMETTEELPEHVQILREANQVRARIAPQQADYYYLHLADLLLALRAHGSPEKITVLDFGAGGSPYRSLFPNADYRTADFAGADYQIDGNGRTNAPDATFDLVLSTQVLEHCRWPDRYLAEVRRVLKEHGRLVLSTHGLFEEHGCPYDFFRWTADGLRSVIEENGFQVRSMARVTAGPRAGFHLLQSSLSQELLDRQPLLIRLLGRVLFRLLLARRFWNAFLDRVFPEYRVVMSSDLPFANTCVTLLSESVLVENLTDTSS